MSSPQPSDSLSNEQPGPWATKWKENHGNFLVGFVIVVALINIMIVGYRQARFVPIQFPDATAFDEPADGRVLRSENDGKSIGFWVTGAASPHGSVIISVYDSADDFADRKTAIASQTVALDRGNAVWWIEANRLPERFAVVAFHDENEDGVLTENSQLVPIERYGYSSPARYIQPGQRPDYEDVSIDKPAIGERVELFIR